MVKANMIYPMNAELPVAVDRVYNTHILGQLIVGGIVAQPFIHLDDITNRITITFVSVIGVLFQVTMMILNMIYGTNIQLDTSFLLIGFAIRILPHIILPRIVTILLFAFAILTAHQRGLGWVRQIGRGFVEAH
jgi:hypothetical protein